MVLFLNCLFILCFQEKADGAYRWLFLKRFLIVVLHVISLFLLDNSSCLSKNGTNETCNGQTERLLMSILQVASFLNSVCWWIDVTMVNWSMLFHHIAHLPLMHNVRHILRHIPKNCMLLRYLHYTKSYF